MIKKLRSVFAIALALSVVFCGACADAKCKHETTTPTGFYKEIDGKVFVQEKCDDCKAMATGEEIEVFAIAENANELVVAQQEKDYCAGAKILLKSGEYQTLSVIAYDGVTLICEQGVKAEKVAITAGVSDVIIDGINFFSQQTAGGITFGSEYKTTNVTIKNCTFTGKTNVSNYNETKVVNLVMDNCTMKGLSDYGTFTAIVLYGYEGITIKNCVFDGIGYNVLQIGNKARGGAISVKNNVFKNVGNRVLYFVNLSDIEKCEIEGNYFYDNTDCPDTHPGAYIQGGGGTRITVGVNYWEIIPENDAKFITSRADYDPSIQLKIPNE